MSPAGFDVSQRARRGLLVTGVTVMAAVSAIAVAGASAASPSSTTAGAATAGEWPLPGANLQNTRNVPGPITSTNVAKLKKAWSVPIRATGTFGTYATTPIVIGGTVYTQDINSNVYSINLKSGKVNWFKKYNSPSVRPNGVTVSNGVVYGATGDAAFALQASTGEQLWTKKLTRNKNEGIDMAPGVNNGTVYVSTVPGNAKGFYNGNGQAVLWALNAKTGAAVWKWQEVPQDLWSKTHTNINSGGGQWDPPSFDANGDLYIGVSNPAPFPGAKGFPYGSSRPGKDLYTDSIVKLNHSTGKLHLALPADAARHQRLGHGEPAHPHDGQRQGRRHRRRQGRHRGRRRPSTGKLLWKTPVGTHNGHDHDGLLTLGSGQGEAQVPVQGLSGHPRWRRVPARLRRHQCLRRRQQPRPRPTRTTPRPASSSATSPRARATSWRSNQATGKIAWDHEVTQSPVRCREPHQRRASSRRPTTASSGRCQHEDGQDALERQAPGRHEHAGRDRRRHRDHEQASFPQGQGPEGHDRRLQARVLTLFTRPRVGRLQR